MRLAPLLLAVVALLIYVPGAAVAPLIDRDEPRFAQATREMMQRHEWVVPYFNGEYRFDKPILIYWLMRPFYAVFGASELTARMPSILSAVLLGWLVFWIGRRWFSDRVGLLAAFGLLTCLQLLVHARSAVADMPMVAMVVVAQWAAWELVHVQVPNSRIHGEKREYPWRWFWLLYGALGLGFLAKGPVPLVVLTLTFLLFRIALWRRPIRWSRLKLLPGLAVVLGVVATWGVPVLVRTSGEFWIVFMGSHVYERGLRAFDGHGGFFLYYVVMALVSLFPWVALAGNGAVFLRRAWNETNAYLCSWMLGTYLLCSVYTTKLPHYVMPAFPAFFLILAQAADAGFPRPRWARTFFWAVISLMGVVVVVALAGAFLTPIASPYAMLQVVVVGFAGIVAPLAWLAIRWRDGRNPRAVLTLLLIALGGFLLGTGLRDVTPAVHLEPLFAEMPAGAEFACYRFTEPTLVFYSNRKVQELKSIEEVVAFLARPGPRLLVTLEREVDLEQYLKWCVGQTARRGTELVARDYSADLAGIDTNGLNTLSLDGINVARTSGARLQVFWRK